jgi:hypothetical protein
MGLYSRDVYSRALPEISVDSDPQIGGDSRGPSPFAQRGGTTPDSGRVSSHLALFYRDDHEFSDRASEFLRPAIECDGSAVFIGTPAHRELVQARLENDGLELASATASGAYLGLDASETIRRFVVAGWPDPGGFWRVVNPLVARPARVKGPALAGRPVRIVEEAVACLWEAGAVSAALEVETLWHELGERYPFALLCAYPARSVAGRHHDAALAQVRRLHDSVICAPPPGE